MQPGSNFVVEMHNATRMATRMAARTIMVLSPALESPYCTSEWAREAAQAMVVELVDGACGPV